MENTNIKCKCGAVIFDEEIDFYNKENEIGEPCSDVSFICKECKEDVGAYQLGHFDDLQDAKDFLNDYINSSNNL